MRIAGRKIRPYSSRLMVALKTLPAKPSSAPTWPCHVQARQDQASLFSSMAIATFRPTQLAITSLTGIISRSLCTSNSPPTEGDVALADWSAAEHLTRWRSRLLKSDNNHFVFQTMSGGNTITSESTALRDVWRSTTLPGDEDRRSAHALCERRSRRFHKATVPFRLTLNVPLLLGAFKPRASGAAHGWLDEIAFHKRGLTAPEIASLYRSHTGTVCGLD